MSNVVFFGSRRLKGNKESINIINKELDKLSEDDVVITSGKTKGICQMIVDCAAKKAITTKLFYANPRYAAGMYYRRSKKIIDNADKVIVIWDGKSKGTKNEIEMAKKMQKTVKIYKVESSDEFDTFEW